MCGCHQLPVPNVGPHPRAAVPARSDPLQHLATCLHREPKGEAGRAPPQFPRVNFGHSYFFFPSPILHAINERFLQKSLKTCKLETYPLLDSSFPPVYESGKNGNGREQRGEKRSAGISPAQILKIDEDRKRRPLKAELHLIPGSRDDAPRVAPDAPPRSHPGLDVHLWGLLPRNSGKKSN